MHKIIFNGSSVHITKVHQDLSWTMYKYSKKETKPMFVLFYKGAINPSPLPFICMTSITWISDWVRYCSDCRKGLSRSFLLTRIISLRTNTYLFSATFLTLQISIRAWKRNKYRSCSFPSFPLTLNQFWKRKKKYIFNTNYTLVKQLNHS